MRAARNLFNSNAVVFNISSKRSQYPSAATVFKDWRLLLAFGFGSGLSRIMPGTCGTIAAFPLFFFIHQLPLLPYLLILVLAVVAGVYLCGYATNKLGVHDHGGIVWDEFVGLWITLIAVPPQWQWLLVGFLLFRFFDMVKPWPISWLDKYVHGGIGIMLDDIVAGFMALGCLQLIRVSF